MNIPLFKSLKLLPEEKFNGIKNNKFDNSPIGLSNSLRGFSTGNMNIDLTGFNKLEIPVLLITGSLDHKFTDINKIFVNEFSNGTHKIINNAGHITHIEKEDEFISIVANFLINSF